MKRALLTGATGFIGSKFVHKLIEQGVEVVHIAPTEELAHTFDGSATGIVCSLRDMPLLAESLGAVKFDVLYHLAWDGVSTDVKNDFKKQFSNVEYGLNACRLANMIGCAHVIIPGSVSEYAYSTEPVDGCGMPCPSDAYGAAKASTRVACDLYARQHDLSLNWMLISSVYGPGRFDSNIITYSIRSLLNKEIPSYTPLEQQWDYLYIDDLIDALYAVGCSGKKGRVYAVGSGSTRPLYAYVEIIRDKINPSAKLDIGEIPYKTGRIDNSIVDTSLLEQDTGFAARITFESGIDRTIRSFQVLVEGEQDE